MATDIFILEMVVFFDLIAIGMIVPILPAHVIKLGGTPITIGSLGSIYAAAQFVSGPLIGSLSDITERKTILITTLVLCSGFYTAIGLTHSIYVILFLRAMVGLCKQTQMLTRALLPDYEPRPAQQSHIFGVMAALGSAGMSIGPAVGGHIMDGYPNDGVSYITKIVGIFFLTNATLVTYMASVKKKENKKKSNNPQSSLVKSVITNLKQSFKDLIDVNWSEYWEILLLKGLIGFALGVYYSSYSHYLSTIFHTSTVHIGYVIAFQSIIAAFSSYFISYINKLYTDDDNFSQRINHVFLILSIAQVGMILSWNIEMYIVCLVPLAIGNSVGRLVTMEMILKRSAASDRGKLIGAANSVRSLAGVLAPMATGVVVQYFGIESILALSLSATFCGFVVINLLKYKFTSERVKQD